MKKALFAVLYICVLITGCTLGGIALADNPTHSYEGKVVFDSEEEYSRFKTAIGQDHIEIADMTVLSSNPPIVVDFKVKDHSRALSFEWGKLYSDSLAVLMIAAFAVGIGLLSLIMKAPSKQEEVSC